jgi:hypothetical protein
VFQNWQVLSLRIGIPEKSSGWEETSQGSDFSASHCEQLPSQKLQSSTYEFCHLKSPAPNNHRFVKLEKRGEEMNLRPVAAVNPTAAVPLASTFKLFLRSTGKENNGRVISSRNTLIVPTVGEKTRYSPP